MALPNLGFFGRIGTDPPDRTAGENAISLSFLQARVIGARMSPSSSSMSSNCTSGAFFPLPGVLIFPLGVALLDVLFFVGVLAKTLGSDVIGSSMVCVSFRFFMGVYGRGAGLAAIFNGQGKYLFLSYSKGG